MSTRATRLFAVALIPAAALLFGAERALATADAGGDPKATASAPTTDKTVHTVKVVVTKDGENGEPTTMVFDSDDPEAGASAVFVGEDGKVQTFEAPVGAPGNFHWISSDSEPHGYLGAFLTDLTPELRTHFGASAEAGVMVGKVEAGSPAEAAGLQVGDVITAVDGERVASSGDVRRRIRALDDGETAALEVRRDGKLVNLAATVVQRQVPEVDASRFIWHAGDAPGVYELDTEAMGDAVKRLSDRVASPEFQGKLIRLQGAEGDLNKRLEELEAKLKDLERQLDETKAKKSDG